MPRSEIQAKIVQSDAGFHNTITEVVFSGTHLIFHNSIPLDTANGVFHTYAQDRDRAVEFFAQERVLFYAVSSLAGLWSHQTRCNPETQYPDTDGSQPAKPDRFHQRFSCHVWFLDQSEWEAGF